MFLKMNEEDEEIESGRIFRIKEMLLRPIEDYPSSELPNCLRFYGGKVALGRVDIQSLPLKTLVRGCFTNKRKRKFCLFPKDILGVKEDIAKTSFYLPNFLSAPGSGGYQYGRVVWLIGDKRLTF